MILQHFTCPRGGGFVIRLWTPSVLSPGDTTPENWGDGISGSLPFEISWESKSNMSKSWRVKRTNGRLTLWVILPHPTVNLICVTLLFSSSELELDVFVDVKSRGVSSRRNRTTKSLAIKTGPLSCKKATTHKKKLKIWSQASWFKSNYQYESLQSSRFRR